MTAVRHFNHCRAGQKLRFPGVSVYDPGMRAILPTLNSKQRIIVAHWAWPALTDRNL